MIVGGFTRCSFGGVSDADLVIPNVLPSGMSSVQSSSAAERANFALVRPVNGCSRGANESMLEIPVTSNTPFGEDYGDHRECTLDALTLNEVSGVAVLVTLHTHLPGDPCPAHSLWWHPSMLTSCCAENQGWPRGRRVDSRTARAAMNSKSQAFCLFCEHISAQVHSLYTPKECNICDERCACFECYRQETLEECDNGFQEMIWCESCRTCTCYECWVSGALVAWETSPPTLR